MTTTTPGPDASDLPSERPEVTLLELTEGRYMSADDVSRRLGITRNALNLLTYEQAHGGRAYGEPVGGKQPWSPASQRAQLLPQPYVRLKWTLVWEAAAVEEVADEFLALKPKRGRPKSPSK